MTAIERTFSAVDAAVTAGKMSTNDAAARRGWAMLNALATLVLDGAITRGEMLAEAMALAHAAGVLGLDLSAGLSVDMPAWWCGAVAS